MSDRGQAARRWATAAGDATAESLDVWAERFARAGRLTLNFHPDRICRQGHTAAAGLLRDGRYRSQWLTGISAGSRSAMAGGERQRFERELFAGAYDTADPLATEHPIYGAFDLLVDDHGGSPRFGSSFVVLRRHVLERTTLCVGDSHMGPRDVGTVHAPWSILAGLAEQAAERNLLNRGLGLDALICALDGSHQSGGPSRDLDGYIEAQVHEGVSLAEDVEAVVLDPSFRGTTVGMDVAEAAGTYGFELRWHGGSELHASEVPGDFRGPTMPELAASVARPDGVVDAHAIGGAAARITCDDPHPHGDPPDSTLQQLKYLWHTLLALGRDAQAR